MRDIPGTIQDATTTLTRYEDFKKSHLNTERLCSEDGFSFCPMIVEGAGGAWGPSASKVFSELAKTKAFVFGESSNLVLKQLYETLGIVLHRENARAVVKRLGARVPSRVPGAVLAAATTLQADAS